MGILIVLGGVAAALALAFKGKGGAHVPGTDLAPVFATIEAGSKAGQVKRLGANWPWATTSGAETGAESSAGDAITVLATAVLEGNPAQIVTGSVRDAGEFTVTRMSQTQWDWVTSGVESSGSSANRGAAVIEAFKSLASETDWLTGLPDMQGAGAPLPEPPGPTIVDLVGNVVPAGPAKESNGLLHAGNKITILDVAKWLSFAQPIIRDTITAGGNAVDIFVALFGNVPDTTRFAKNRTITQVTDDAQKILTRFLDGQFLDPTAPDIVIAYLIAGGMPPKVPPSLGVAFRVHFAPKPSTVFAVVAKAKPVAAGLQPGSGEWVWAIWNGSRGFDVNALQAGVEPSRSKAINMGRFVAKNGAPPEHTVGVKGHPPTTHVPQRTPTGVPNQGKPINPKDDSGKPVPDYIWAGSWVAATYESSKPAHADGNVWLVIQGSSYGTLHTPKGAVIGNFWIEGVVNTEAEGLKAHLGDPLPWQPWDPKPESPGEPGWSLDDFS